MKSVKRIEFFILSLVLVLLCAVGGFLFFSNNTWDGVFHLNLYKNYNKEDMGKGDYTFTSINKLDVDLISSSVIVVPSNDSKVHVSVKGSNVDRVRATLDGDELVIAENENCFMFCVGSSKITVSVPSKMYDDFKIDTVSGKIEVQGIEASMLNLESVSGKVTVDDANFSKLRLDTVSGGFDLISTNTFESIRIDSVSGGASIQLPKMDCVNATLDSVSGRITNELGACNAPVINMDSVSGSLKITK